MFDLREEESENLRTIHNWCLPGFFLNKNIRSHPRKP